jgi:hypothetical protein
LTIHQTYADDGVSGTVPVELRPLGARLLEDARHHQITEQRLPNRRHHLQQQLLYEPIQHRWDS